MNIVLLDSDTLGDINLDKLRALGNFKAYPYTKAKDTISRCIDADVVVTNKVVFNKETLDALPKLKLIAIAATGMNNVDLEYAKSKGIEVKNVSGYSTNSVVQHTFMLALSLIGKLNYYNRYVKTHQWESSPIFTNLEESFFEISGKSWGIIGLGAIGKGVAKVASSFGANVCYYSTSKTKHSNEYPHKELNELMRSCDIVSIHAPLNSNTLNLIDKDELSLLKDGAVLINVGRGGIVNEEALSKEIRSGRIYAGLDVISKEPIESSNPLSSVLEMDNIIVTPHNAWGSIEARQRLLDGIVKNIKNFLEQE